MKAVLTLKDALPCPFCGSADLNISCETYYNMPSVYCKVCGGTGGQSYNDDPLEAESLAIGIWNKRVSNDKPFSEKIAISIMDMLDDSGREAVMNHYCHGCGCILENKPFGICHCQNEE